MAEKKTEVMRVPIELVERINIYEKTLASNGIRMGKTDVMRNFAENAITPRDNLGSVIGVLDRASRKKV